MNLQPGTEISREVVIHYEPPPNAWRSAMRELQWSWAKALTFVGIPEEHAAVSTGALAPEDWAPLIEALQAEAQRLTAELAPLLVADPGWCRVHHIDDDWFEGAKGGAVWLVTLHSEASDRACVTHYPDGTWGIDDAGGPGVEATISEVTSELVGNGETDFLDDPTCWHPALRAHL